MADNTLTELNSSTTKVVNAAVVETMRHASPILDELVDDNIKTIGGTGYGWQVQTGLSPYSGTYTAGGDFDYGVKEQIARAQMDFTDYFHTMSIANSDWKKNQGDINKLWDIAKGKIALLQTTRKRNLGRDMVSDGAEFTETVSGTEVTRGRIPGLKALCTPDTIYAEHTPELASNTKLWWQPFALNMLSATCPSNGKSSGFPDGGAALDWYALSTKDSKYYLPTQMQRAKTNANKYGLMLNRFYVDQSTFNAFAECVNKGLVQAQSQTFGSLGWEAYKYGNTMVIYDPAIDEEAPLYGYTNNGVCFGIAFSTMQARLCKGLEGKWTGFAPPSQNTTDTFVGNANESLVVACEQRAAAFMLYNMPTIG